MSAARVLILSFVFLASGFLQGQGTRFEVITSLPPASGRLFIVIGKRPQPEPRNTIGETGMSAPPVLARDVKNLGAGGVAVIDRTAAIFPIDALDALPAGDYYIQALFASNIDLKSLDAPGNRYSKVQRVHLDPRRGGTVKVELTETIPPEQLPPEDQYVKYVKIQSDLLTRFHGRPIYLRAGVILPREYSNADSRRYPLRVHIGGFGTRFTAVQRLMLPNSEFRGMWLASDTPQMIYLQLDGDGPYGDPYQVNSDNNGPYGDAITSELIPYVEKKFRAISQPYARLLDGESTGGWVSLALKVFYPDFFNAVWSACPDGVDFRGFQLIDIYKDKSAYVDDLGVERPSKRDSQGTVEFTIRHECQMENVLGLGDSWTMSGQQWGAWNATYGPHGPDGRPVPIWNPKTGDINRSVVEHWKKYDLRLILEQRWRTLGPKLRGKMHISVGDADSYYLNNAVHMIDAFLQKADPPADARITYGPGQGHCWNSLTAAQIMREMFVTVEQSRPRNGALWEEQKSGTHARLRGVSAVDLDVVWASGSSGTFLRTTDGGMHWQPGAVAGAADLDFRDVHGVSATEAYLLSAGEGEKSRIYKTTDGGRMWTLQFMNHEPRAFFDGFAFWDAANGIAFSDPVDDRFLIIRTEDGGATWKEIPGANMPMAVSGEAAFAASGTSIAVSGRDHAWIGTGGSVARVFRSTDRGLTWSVSNSPLVSGNSTSGIFSVFFTGPLDGYIVGGDYREENRISANFAKTTDGGRTWTLGARLRGYRSAIHGASRENAGILIAVGPSGTDYLPQGGPWVRIGGTGYDAISFLPGLATGWAVGQNGRVARWHEKP